MLFTAWADALQFEARQKGLLTDIAEIIQRHSKLQLRRLYKRTQAMEHHALAERYQRLAAAELPPNQCLLPLGWGTGWMSKTFGIRLLKNEPLRRQIFSRYKHS